MRVHELAKQLGLGSKELVAKLRELGLEVKSHMSTVDEATIARLKGEAPAAEAAPASPAPTPEAPVADAIPAAEPAPAVAPEPKAAPSAPEAAPKTDGLPRASHSMPAHVSAPAAAEKCVAANALEAIPSDANALPALNPNQPTHSIPAPSTV